MYSNEHQIVYGIYLWFCGKVDKGTIPVHLRPPALVGTVQDDPFDSFVCEEISNAFPDLEVISSGKLTSPDIVIRDKKTGVIVGLEVKKLIQKPSGADSRGLTMDYNSCLPCGTALIKIGDASVDIPCYYLFCLLSNDSSRIVTMVLVHGDFLNYDFNLHKHAKVANQSEYNHGPYGEGSVRHRAMYTYPNPLNHKLACFYGRKVFVLKKKDCDRLHLSRFVSHEIFRRDVYGNNFLYSVVSNDFSGSTEVPIAVDDVFGACKRRVKKNRVTSAMPVLEK